MKNIGYLLVAIASLSFIAFIGNKFYKDYKAKEQQDELTKIDRIHYVVSQIINIKELYHLTINIDSLSKDAFNSEDKIKAIGRLSSYRDSILQANK